MEERVGRAATFISGRRKAIGEALRQTRTRALWALVELKEKATALKSGL
ncbi:hypothetical protein [Sinorhizobium meliloti]|nr:hypothetical protein [Sinorhizobium meliloti]MDE3856962.1 hypothetical protein [Sinorhizobium meliloti]MQW48034.1 hypothetical protein [Sinorhizobium meliloti]